MSIVDAQFVGGPFDGPNEVKDGSGFGWVIVPYNSTLCLYVRHAEGEPYFYTESGEFSQLIQVVRHLKDIAGEELAQAMAPLPIPEEKP